MPGTLDDGHRDGHLGDDSTHSAPTLSTLTMSAPTGTTNTDLAATTVDHGYVVMPPNSRSKGSLTMVVVLLLLTMVAAGIIIYLAWKNATTNRNCDDSVTKCGKLRCQNFGYCDTDSASEPSASGMRCVCSRGYSGDQCQFAPPTDSLRYGQKVYLKSLRTASIYPGYSVPTYLTQSSNIDHPTVTVASGPTDSPRQQWIINDRNGDTLDEDVVRYGDTILLRWCNDPSVFLGGSTGGTSTSSTALTTVSAVAADSACGTLMSAPRSDLATITPIIVRNQLNERSREIVRQGDSVLLLTNPATSLGNFRDRIGACAATTTTTTVNSWDVVVNTTRGSSETVWSFIPVKTVQ
jgi:hypothetical protein